MVEFLWKLCVVFILLRQTFKRDDFDKSSNSGFWLKCLWLLNFKFDEIDKFDISFILGELDRVGLQRRHIFGDSSFNVGFLL